MKKIEFVLKAKEEGKRFLADARWSKEGKLPVVLFIHGFKGFKDWGAFDMMANQFADAGYCCIKMNFHSNGTTLDMPFEVVDKEAFAQNNFSKELDDIGVMIDWLHSDECPFENLDLQHINIIGHSRGGGVVLLKAAEDDRIKKVATLASIPRVDSFNEETMKEWKTNGVTYVLNGRTQEQLPLYYQVAEDYYANESRLDVALNIKKLAIPVMCIHGDEGETVPLQSLHYLKQLQPKIKDITIKGGSHTFNTKHPWTEPQLSPEMQEAMTHVLNHFGE
ncbi:alpha/beta hydrolase family protein [Flammeovirga pacifica]|uniref:AB hydrolase-1 domain-containing protein n=1 Tax=Flammeovirga pacifica TaxID=915059 RepID=A0A1S1YZK5_FLAPC|nr:alpha/beta fold hydrolase [Flammeovirga pacifica]OHX66446.1 hypothetical protein NH26_08785 [Flammeovirga pacifica]